MMKLVVAHRKTSSHDGIEFAKIQLIAEFNKTN